MIYQILIKSKRRFYIIILFSWVYKDWKLLVSFHFNSSSSLSIWLFFKIISKLQIYLIIFKKSENDSNMLSEISCFSVFFIFKNGKYFTVIKYVSLYFWTKISNTINKHALTSFYFGMKAKKLLTCFLWKEKKKCKEYVYIHAIYKLQYKKNDYTFHRHSRCHHHHHHPPSNHQRHHYCHH